MPPSAPSPSGPYVLAVDLGTSGPKAAVVSLQGKIMSRGRAHVETLAVDGGVEQDPEAVWEACKVACRRCVADSGLPPADIQAVICSSQYSSVVPVDREGRPTMNMILWQDRRGDPRLLKKSTSFPRNADNPVQLLRWIRIHGLPPVGEGAESLGHARYIKFARPDVYARTDKFLEPMDFVNLRLTGRAAANLCTAFMFLVTDNRNLEGTQYSEPLLRYSLVDREKMPELVPINSILGTLKPDVAADLGLLPSTRVITGLNDTQSGGMGTAAFRGNHAGISVGTTSVMISHAPFKKTDVLHAMLTMPSPVPKTYFVMAENGVGGAALEHFLEHLIYSKDDFGDLGHEDRFTALDRAVRSVAPGSEGVLFLPWMSGSIAPAADSKMRGGFLNLSLTTRRSHLARAVLEGVALNLRWLRGPVEKFVKHPFSHFVYYGGGAESDAWSQIMADVLGSPVHQMDEPQYATCLGAALLAFERLGLLRFDEFERLIPIRRVYEPNPANRAVYDALFEQFVAAFKRTRPIFRALNTKVASK